MSENWELALQALEPADAEIDAALFRGDEAAAMAAAYRAANDAVEALVGEDGRTPGVAHGVWVELTPNALLALEDGTLVDRGAFVSLSYRSWVVDTG